MTTVRRADWALPLAIALWLVIFGAIMSNVALHPDKHTTMPTYRTAAIQWWAGHDIYTHDNHAGYYYFPQGAVLFTPFAYLPSLAGDFAWRGAIFALFAYGLLKLSRGFLARSDQPWTKAFFFLSLLAMPSSLASLRNAQFDLLLAALVVLAAAETGAGSWGLAAFWLCLAVAFKPLGVVPLLLFGAIYWPLIPRLAIGLLIVAVFPLAHWNPAYAAHEYSRCVEALLWAAQPNEPKFSDLAALLSHIDIVLPPLVLTVLRLLFAPTFLVIGFIGARRLSLLDSAWLVGSLSTVYLMLFNPRTEACSFVFLGPFIAALAIYYAQRGARPILVVWLSLLALGLACDALPVIHPLTDRWLKPLIALIFLPHLLWFIFKTPKEPTKPAL